MLELLERVLGKQRKRAEQSIDRYKALAFQLADGKREPSTDEVLEILQAVGKTTEDLKSLVERINHRKELRLRVIDPAKQQRRREEIEKAIAAQAQLLEAAQQRYEQAIHPLVNQMSQLQEEQQESNSARRQLMDEYEGPIHAEIDANNQTLAEIKRELSTLDDNIYRFSGALNSEKDDAEKKRLESKLESFNARVSELQRHQDVLVKRNNELVESMIQSPL